MRPVQAQFARRRRPGRVLWSIGAIAFATAVVMAALAWQQRTKLELARKALETAQREAAQAPSRTPSPATPPPYEASAREMLRERSLPWPQVLTALESVAMIGVTPTAVDMVASEPIVRVEVSFSDHARLLEYLSALNAGVPESGPAWRWALVQAQLPQTGMGVATLHAKWDTR